jgi:hypothetical protein
MWLNNKFANYPLVQNCFRRLGEVLKTTDRIIFFLQTEYRIYETFFRLFLKNT